VIVLFVIAVAGSVLYAFLQPPMPEPEIREETADSGAEVLAAQSETALQTDVQL
jgi:hypothetical protein